MEEFWRLGHPNPVYYNCSKYTFDQWLTRGTKRPVLAVYLLVSGLVFVACYLVALCGMVRGRLFAKNPCYIIMFFMGLADLGSLQVSSTISGLLCWQGTVFCNYPNLVYIAGSLGLGLWSMSCGFCILLAVNRLAEVAGWKQVSSFFRPSNVICLCLICVGYGLFMILFTPPPLFYSTLVAWFANPFNESGLEYQNLIHSINNGVVSVLAILAYLGICCKVTGDWGKVGGGLQMTRAQKLLYVQAFIICTTHVMAAWGYMLMNHIPNFPPKLILGGQVAWQWSHGTPGMVYLILNRTIRKNVKSMCCGGSPILPTTFSATSSKSKPINSIEPTAIDLTI